MNEFKVKVAVKMGCVSNCTLNLHIYISLLTEHLILQSYQQFLVLESALARGSDLIKDSIILVKSIFQ